MQGDANGSGQVASAGSGGNDTPGIPDVKTGPEPVTAKPRKRVRAGVFVAAAHDLTLLQLGCGGAFQPVAIGNARDVAAGDAAVAVGTGTSGRSFTPVTGNVAGTNAATTIAGHHLTGLLQTTAQVIPGQSTGGPLVNLTGQVIGIDLTGTARGTRVAGYAVPVNEALAVARRLKH